jgi:hypothetical protein
MGRPRKNPESTEAVVPAKEKKEKKSFTAFWDGYKEKIRNASEREQNIAEEAAKAAWESK